MTLSDQRLIDKDGNLVETPTSESKVIKAERKRVSCCQCVRQDELSNVNLCLAKIALSECVLP